MSKAGFFFYTGDWVKKTRGLSLQAKGAWIELLVIMDECKPRGIITWSVDQYSRFFGVSCEIAGGVLLEIERSGVANITPSLHGVTFASRVTACDFKVTVVSRRMQREEKAKKSHKLRQVRYRARRSSDATGDAEKQRLSSSSSISSSISNDSKKNHLERKTTTPYPENFSISEQLRDWCSKQGVEPESHLEAFRDYHTSKGSRFVDWTAAFRTWVRNSFKFDRQQQPTGSDRLKRVLVRGL